MSVIRATLRLFFRPASLAVGVVAAWLVWWVWPERPLRSVTLSGFDDYSMMVSPHGRYAYFASVSGAKPSILVHWPTGEKIVSGAVVQGLPTYLECDRMLVQDNGFEPEFPRLIELASGRVIWEVKDATALCWSKNGSFVVASDNHSSMLIALNELGDHHTIRFPKAASAFAIDSSGTCLVSLMEDDPSAIVMWNPHNGLELRRHRVAGSTMRKVAVSHNGKRVVAFYSRVDDGPPTLGAYLWDVTSGGLGNLIPFKSSEGFTNKHFDPHDRYVIGSELWDIRTNPPALVKTNGVPWFNVTGTRYVAGLGSFFMHLSRDNPWMVYDVETHQEVARFKELAWDPQCMSTNGPWLFFSPGFLEQPFWHDWWRRVTGHSINIDSSYVLNLESGEIVKRITDIGIGGITTASHLWTFNHQSSEDGHSPESTVFSEWSLAPVHPPWWLWLLSAAGALFILADLRRTWQRRAQPAAA